jgi:hypothetical protein
MFRILFGVIWLSGFGLAPALAEVSPSQPQVAPAQTPAPQPPAVVPDRRADSLLPQSGVIQPAPDATRDATVKPPNVDPGMAIAPPGTAGGNPRIDPK